MKGCLEMHIFVSKKTCSGYTEVGPYKLVPSVCDTSECGKNQFGQLKAEPKSGGSRNFTQEQIK